MSILFADAWLITMNERRDVLESASVCVERDRIAAVGTRRDLLRRFPEAEVVDCKGRIVTDFDVAPAASAKLLRP